MLMISITPNINVSPDAINAYTPPVNIPVMIAPISRLRFIVNLLALLYFVRNGFRREAPTLPSWWMPSSTKAALGPPYGFNFLGPRGFGVLRRSRCRACRKHRDKLPLLPLDQ